MVDFTSLLSSATCYATLFLFCFPSLQILVIYNFGCAAISLYTLIGFGRNLIASDDIYSKESNGSLKDVFFWYWITKMVELFDTVFMVLRHKRRQISVLHVYHHASMLLLSDLAYHHFPWTAIAVILALNALVHVVLYFYYGLSALYPDKPPPWKRRVTELQILQFFIDLIYGTIGYLYHGFCIYGIIYGLLMVYLFLNFYYHAYLKPRSSVKKQVQNGTQNGAKKIK